MSLLLALLEFIFDVFSFLRTRLRTKLNIRSLGHSTTKIVIFVYRDEMDTLGGVHFDQRFVHAIVSFAYDFLTVPVLLALCVLPRSPLCALVG